MPSQGKTDESVEDGVMGSPYLAATPVVDAQAYIPDFPVTASFFRSVANTHTAFVMEHTIDQLARRADKDPAAYRRALYIKAGFHRHQAVLDMVCEKAGWGQPLEGRMGARTGCPCLLRLGGRAGRRGEPDQWRAARAPRRRRRRLRPSGGPRPDRRPNRGWRLFWPVGGALQPLDAQGRRRPADQFRSVSGAADERGRRASKPTSCPRPPIPPASAGIAVPGIAPAVANALLVLTGKPVNSLPMVTT